MPTHHSRSVRFQPSAALRFQRGVDTIVGAIRPTLGPRPRLAAIDTGIAGKPPELLDSGALIARRIIGLPHPDEDIGAMFVRGMLWRLHEQAGDGTATAALLFQAVYAGGLRYIAAGGDPMALRRQIERGLALLLEQLRIMTRPVAGQAQLTQLAEAICDDPPLAALLGEIFDVIGEHGQLDLRAGRGRELDREYVEGAHWESGVLSPYMLPEHVPQRTTLEQAAIAISDLEIDDPRQLVPLLELALRHRIRALVIVAKRLSDAAISLLLANRRPGEFEPIAIRTPGLLLDDQAAAMTDIAAMAGGRPLHSAAGARISTIALEDLGSTRRAWADRAFFGMAGGGAGPRDFRAHVRALRASFASTSDLATREKLQRRIGRLLGGSATLWIGGASEPALEARKQLAERAAAVLRGAVRDGVVLGGGAALLACRPALRCAHAQSTNTDERAAYGILLGALEAPVRTIIQNAGQDPSSVMVEIEQSGAGYGFDARAERVVNLAGAGIFDAAPTLIAAVRAGVSSAALALTIDAHVHTHRTALGLSPEG
ncbi:MAG TPA: TCP-1/cpn60 chaperonin family protein [Roseiflexaceae bacterium]|nr:TCP-1/cpn60 chaperonin family protein [Roseiflexaceae bacterium]